MRSDRFYQRNRIKNLFPSVFRNGVLLVFVLAFPGWAFGEAKESNIQIPLVPPEALEEAKAMVNPLPSTERVLNEGRENYRRACVACHGINGKGDGPITKMHTVDPKPRNFTNPEFQKVRSDGELFWVLKHGSHQTEMMRMDFFFTDQELWGLIKYIRAFDPQTP